MADFVQTMKDWRRMCDWLTGEYGDDSCLHCPVYECSEEYNGCDAIFTKWAETMGWAKFEEIIETWCDEHPKPVYPSVAKYLERLGIIIRRDGTVEADFFKANEPMSADVAKLLGVEPKGDV